METFTCSSEGRGWRRRHLLTRHLGGQPPRSTRPAGSAAPVREPPLSPGRSRLFGSRWAETPEPQAAHTHIEAIAGTRTQTAGEPLSSEAVPAPTNETSSRGSAQTPLQEKHRSRRRMSAERPAFRRMERPWSAKEGAGGYQALPTDLPALARRCPSSSRA